ncbi:glycosyltransferase family 10 domain-containing protein [Mucilaginibacter sp. UR6-11]|uniref:glycosyltransferase family 10 domain-containing protein n=1 Tax=Mucilaginibacter sp. UR6-11 TaxID=1435644 RepID=UPI001E632E9F|nr:glycosyltransferase family 10 [Mucilaginibacter sp. UR6-11]MCC8423976.1 glycosyltransferase family 10 [Mucilaginibacter sp. UR6-11]
MRRYSVKISFPFKEWPLMRQTPNWTGQWGDYFFFIDDDITECDFWIFYSNYNLQKQTCLCPPENIIFIPAEPFSVERFSSRFLKQFALIISCQREIVHPNISYNLEGHPWFVNKSYDELQSLAPLQKSRKISIITSNKIQTDGHKRRLDFSLRLKDYFKDEIDLFGRGLKDFEDKWDTLAPYKYSITMENSSYKDYLSEKFFDCHLAYTYPLYYGCPNAAKYFSEKSFTPININNFDESLKSIETVLNDENFYADRLKYICDGRAKVLNNYNLFPLLVSYMKQMDGNAAKKAVTISPQWSFKKYISRIVKQNFIR